MGFFKDVIWELLRPFTNEKITDNAITPEISKSLKFLNTDLVEVCDSRVCCSVCAMYRKRIYSVSGKDKRFPKFPADFHTTCGLKPYPFVFGVSEPTFSCKNIIKYSNRPFVDDRTKKEIEQHLNWKSQIEKKGKKT